MSTEVHKNTSKQLDSRFTFQDIFQMCIQLWEEIYWP